MGASSARKQDFSNDYDIAEDDDMYSTRSSTSVKRYKQPAKPVEHDTLEDLNIQRGKPVQRRNAPSRAGASTGTGADTNNGMASRAVSTPIKAAKGRVQIGQVGGIGKVGRVGKVRPLPLLAALGGMLAMALLAYGVMAFGAWWQMHQNDVQYGRPRTYQFDAVVGHNDSPANPTHFICINLNRHVEIIEFPGGDATHARIYQGPVLFGDGQDLTPVTAEVRDVNGDGKPDLIVHIQDQQIVFINDGTQFRPLKPGEQVNLGS